MAIKLVEDTIDRADIDALAEWLKTYPKLTKGELTKRFEKEFSSLVGAKYCVFVNSGSSANLLALYACRLTTYIDPKNVLVPALSWATDVAPLIQLGMKPIYVDCNIRDLNVDLASLRDRIDKFRSDLFLNVSVLGYAPRMKDIHDICESEPMRIPIIEDNCESLLTDYKGKKLGSWGIMSTWSTYFGHHISTIEGGCVTTNDYNTYQLLLKLRSHGWLRDCDEKEKIREAGENYNEFDILYRFYEPGFNFRNTEIGAFLGLRQVKKAAGFANRRYANEQIYWDNLEGYVELPNSTNDFTPAFAIPIVSAFRDNIVKRLIEADIECRPLIAGSMTKQPMCTYYSSTHLFPCPNAEHIDRFGIYVPNHHNLKEEDIKFVCTTIKKAIDEHRNPITKFGS